MGVLSTTRYEVASVLSNAGLDAHPSQPDRLSVPCVVVEGGPNYLSAGPTFSSNMQITYEITFLIRPGTNEVEDQQLDDMLETGWVALVNGVGSDIVSITAGDKYMPVLAGTEYRAITITLTVQVTL